ncbi:MAG: selenide, water dikinase SelD [Planctomycetales bacterium]|nr:selenide, water dikinase SelD [Planctomycetales bacterium]
MPQEGIAQVVRDLPKFEDENLVVGTEGFSDAGAYRLRDDLLIVQSLDFFPPLVDDPFLFGQIAAANSLSDIYAMGAAPTTVMNIVGFPDDKLELSILSDILRGGADRVLEAGAVVVGGHTVRDVEIKFGLSVTGTVHPDKLFTNQGAKPGDKVILTKAIGTGFVTTAFKMNRCSESTLKTATDSMRTLNKVASEACSEVGVNAVTDITGFGLAGHANEMAQSSGVTINLELSQIPILEGAKELAIQGNKTRASATNRGFAAAQTDIAPNADVLLVEFAFDAQTSGGLLISVSPEKADDLLAKIHDGGITVAAIVGEVTEQASKSLNLT